MPSCPTCDKSFSSQKSVNKHHYPAHGFSICLEDSECAECGQSFKYYPSDKKGIYCSDCSDNSWGNENLSKGTGKDNNNWKGGGVESDCHNCGEEIIASRHNYKKFERNFCNNSCLAEHLSEKFSGKGNPRYIDGKHRQRKYGTGWKKVKRKALERDNYECVVCGKGEEKLNRKPSVHHKKPVRKFQDPQNAHYLDNLVCLCPKHHQEVEAGNRKI